MSTTSERRRLIREALSHDEAYVVSRALLLYAAVQDVDDAQFPDPDKRSASAVAAGLAEDFRAANAARRIEEMS